MIPSCHVEAIEYCLINKQINTFSGSCDKEGGELCKKKVDNPLQQ